MSALALLAEAELGPRHWGFDRVSAESDPPVNTEASFLAAVTPPAPLSLAGPALRMTFVLLLMIV
jgi:hypothetical protein